MTEKAFIPKISSYGEYSSSNYGVNTLRLEFPNIILWYSYETVVAFKHWGRLIVVSQNIWGPTTGKHLNWIDGGGGWSPRLEREEFEKRLSEALELCGLSEF